jgi:C-terminal processing protease CtpA/Prc
LLGFLTDKEFKEWQKYKYRYSKLYQQQRGKHGFLIFTGSIHTVRPKPIKPTVNPLRFNGNLYVLIDGNTGSTAVDFAGIVKYYKLGILVGQETGDTMASYGDILSFKLPNSQLAGMIACKYYEIPGTTNDNAAQGVQPDHYIANSFEDSWNKIDRAVEFVHELCSCD